MKISKKIFFQTMICVSIMITLEILILILTDLDVMGKITSSILMLGALATEIGLIISINQKGKIITKEKNKKC